MEIACVDGEVSLRLIREHTAAAYFISSHDKSYAVRKLTMLWIGPKTNSVEMINKLRKCQPIIPSSLLIEMANFA